MPLLIHVVFWWLAGLIAGTRDWARDVSWVQVSLLLSVLFLAFLVFRRGRGVSSWRHCDPRLVAPLVLVAGLSVSAAASRKEDLCKRLLLSIANGPDAQEFWARIDGLPVPGRSVRAEFRDRQANARCRVKGWMRIAAPGSTNGSGVFSIGDGMVVEAGSHVRVAGKLAMLQRGVRLDKGSISKNGGQDRLILWRATLGQRIDSLFRSRGALVRALLIADQDDIEREVRERYADAGIVHMLSVSGMHVAIIASALLAAGAGLRIPRRHTELASFVVVSFYVALLGFPAPAVRSGVMLMIISVAARMQRPVHEWAALALGAVIPTISPLVVGDPGWQLSVSGMAALVAARAMRVRWQRWARLQRSGTSIMADRSAGSERSKWMQLVISRATLTFTRIASGMALWRGFRGWLLKEIFTGLVATIVTAPMIAWMFGRVSVVAPISNIPAGAVIALLQPALFLALVLSPLRPLASFIADATQPLMLLLDQIAAFFAGLPVSVIPVAPSFTTAAGALLAAGLVVRGTSSRHPKRWWLCAAAALIATLWIDLVRGGSGRFEMHVLDVGQGDAIALRTPRGRWIVIDAGPRTSSGDAARRVIIPYIRRIGGPVALFVLSHAHDDHSGGASTLVNALAPLRWWEPAFVSTSAGYRDALEAVSKSGTLWERVTPGRTLELDGVVLKVLAPDSAWTARQQNANETSVVLRVGYGAHHFLFTGDAEAEEEEWLRQRWTVDELGADVLKVGHHGSRSSSSPELLDAVRPRLAVVSLGSGNRYGHPATETVGEFLERGVPLLRTDRDGTIVVRSDGRRLEVESGGERWELSDAGTHDNEP